MRTSIDLLALHEKLIGFCVGCGLCLGLCPVNAISLKNTRSAITVNFDYTRCIKCNLCVKVCPALSNFHRERPTIGTTLGRIEKVFFGYSADDYIRHNAASGGVITSLVLYMLKKKIVDKALVTKMDGLTAAPMLTNDENEVISAQGSIYFKTFSLHIMKELLSNLRKGNRICVVGLPCQISAIKKILRGFEGGLYLVSCICNHVNEIWYLQHITDRFLPKNTRPTAIGPRKGGWPGEIKISFKSNRRSGKVVVSLSNFWGVLPSTEISSPIGCLLCADAFASNADIVAADAWHPKFTNRKSSGVSMMIVRTPKGLHVIDEAIRDKVLCTEGASLQDLLIAQGLHLIECIDYAPFRQRLLQHRIAAVRELSEIDKVVVLMITVLTTCLLNFRSTKYLLNTSLTEKALRLISWFLSSQKSKKLCRITSILNNSIIGGPQP